MIDWNALTDARFIADSVEHTVVVWATADEDDQPLDGGDPLANATFLAATELAMLIAASGGLNMSAFDAPDGAPLPLPVEARAVRLHMFAVARISLGGSGRN